MRRDLDQLAGATHDVLVIGGGIQGACIAWDAAQRGLAVALVERDDFGAATSANSLRIVHGGLRYLARGDLPRMRESIRERTALLRIAPGLVEPLPVLIPTGRPGVPHKLALGAALALTHLLSLTRNAHLPPDRRIGAGRLVPADECVRLFPALDGTQIDGGALWYDARMIRPERLTLAFVASAVTAGAQVANYVEAEGFQIEGGRISAVDVVDRLDGRRHAIRARQVIVAAGPWTAALAARASGVQAEKRETERQALALNLVVGRRLAEAAVGLKAQPFAGPDPGGSGSRFLFLAPQERYTLLGTWYGIAGSEDTEPALERGAGELLAAFNQACPGLGLTRADIVDRQWGRLPLKAGFESGEANTLADRPRIGSGPSRLGNLLTVEAVKYTTARAVAEDVVDQVLASLSLAPRPCRTAETVLVGAGRSSVGELPLADRMQRAAREEMAVTLGDVVFRRTELGDPPGPSRDQVQRATTIVGDALGWDTGRRAREAAAVLERPTA